MNVDLLRKPLKEIATFKYGKTIRKQDIAETGAFPVFSGYRIVGYLPDFMYEESQLIIVCRGAGGTGDVKMSPSQCSITNLAIVINCDENLVDKGYLYWRLKQSDTYSLRTGSAQPQITINTLETFEVEFEPSLEKQREISKQLFDLDSKIELNRQTNQTLEEMAQAVFKSWFVDFEPTRAKIKARENGQDPTRAAMAALAGKTVDQLDKLSPEQIETLTASAALFPDTVVASELGEIPDGWEAKPLYETAEYVNGAAFKAVDFCDPEEGLPIIKIAELKQGIYEGTKYTLKEVKQRHFITNDDVLYSWSGSPETSLEVFKWFGGDGWLNQHIFKLNFASDEQKCFTYYLLKHMKPVLIAIAQDKQTTGLGHVTVADMKRLLVPYPDDDLLQEFKKLIAPLYEQCSTIEKENITLSEIRDALLPKLLSGEIEINGEVAQ